MSIKKIIKNIYHSLFKEDSDNIVTVVISKSALLNNLNQFINLSDGMVCPVLKSNAYGHGLSEISMLLEKNTTLGDVPFFILDSYFEAKKLRNEGIRRPIIIIGYSSVNVIAKNKIDDLLFTISDIEILDEFRKVLNKPTRINLKLDTGMHRQGIVVEDIQKAINLIKKNNNIILEAICSHFSDAEENREYTIKQIEVWNDLVNKFKKEFNTLKYWHISNTAGHNFLKEAKSNMTRLGAGLYGIKDGANILGVNTIPVLQLETIITSMKKVKKGDPVGYGNTFIARDDMTIATIPVGYFEGVDRRLSNRGVVKIMNNFVPIIGKVSMNITTIDVSMIPGIKIGDKVVVISNIESDPNSMLNISKDTTIARDLAVNIAPHLKRITI